MIGAAEVRRALATREELALLDVRPEARYATAHPLFAAQLPVDRIEVEAPLRLPRRGAPVVLYDDGEGLVEPAAERLRSLGYREVRTLALADWRAAGLELFRDVNSASKAFGELVEARRHTPSIAPLELASWLDNRADVVVLDARPFSEYQAMSIPGSISVPGAELVWRAAVVAPDPRTTIVVNCAGRTRSIIGAQSLINAGVPNLVVALRDGTMGWGLAGLPLEHGQHRRAGAPATSHTGAADVAYRSGVRRIAAADLPALERDRTVYRFDVRTPDEHAAGHPPGFLSAPGGQLVQEIDVFAPIRGARLVLADDRLVRAEMTASWLAQMGWEVYVAEGAFAGPLESEPRSLPPRPATGRYRRPYEGVDHPAAAMRAYLAWELGLVEQLARDGTHGFFVT